MVMIAFLAIVFVSASSECVQLYHVSKVKYSVLPTFIANTWKNTNY